MDASCDTMECSISPESTGVGDLTIGMSSDLNGRICAAKVHLSPVRLPLAPDKDLEYGAHMSNTVENVVESCCC